MSCRVRLISSRRFGVLFALALCVHALAAPQHVNVVKIPYMDVAGLHREYANALLEVALDLSAPRYGPYELFQQTEETVIKRQLLELQKGQNLSVAISMPMPEWQDKAEIVPIPIMKGLASYRLFLALEKNLANFNAIDSLETLKSLRIGQGPGWSTGKILQENGFEVVYGGPYATLLPMLNADRFELLMRSAYEVEAELVRYQPAMPELVVVDGIAIYTYLPMYFFVTKAQPELAERIEYGLKLAHENGHLDKLFNFYFSGTLEMLDLKKRKVFCIPNTNIDPALYERDKPYLLKSVQSYSDAC